MQPKYKTRQREEILSFLRQRPERCFTAKEVREKLLEEGLPLGEATVYRTLDLLCQNGALKRFGAGQGKSATYQYACQNPACEHHLHLKCRSCGVLYHMECRRFAPLWEHLLENHGFQVSQADSILYGVCSACLEKAK